MKLFKEYTIKYRWFNADCLIVAKRFLIDKKTTLGENIGHILTAFCRPDPEETLPRLHN
jgi:hypothetical protein